MKQKILYQIVWVFDIFILMVSIVRIFDLTIKTFGYWVMMIIILTIEYLGLKYIDKKVKD